MNRKLRLIYAIASGLLLSLAWAQWMNSLLLLIALVPLLLIEDYFCRNKQSNKSVNIFLYSLLTFGIWNSISTWWIFNASPAGIVAAVVVNSTLMSIVMWGFHISKRNLGSKFGYFVLVFYWMAFEYFHLNWELTWSWLNLGNGFAKNIIFIQWYEFTGVSGGTIWILVSNIILTIAILKLIRLNSFKLLISNTIILSIWILAPIITSLIIFYNYSEKEDPYNIVVIQPNIDPYTEKFDNLSDAQQLDKILDLASSLSESNVDYFVAPETALPRSMSEKSITKNKNYKRIKKFLEGYNESSFIIGLSSYKVYNTKEKPTITSRQNRDKTLFYDNYNTALQIDDSDNIQLYHKSKLVVGVEKMPYPNALGFLEQFAKDMGGTTGSLGTQVERSVFKNIKDKINIAPVICYESIFGQYVGGYVRNGANLIFVITNDAWWGDTPGYRQHLRFSQLRAIETRRSIARSANTGTSCFINQRGELIKPTEYNTDAAIFTTLNANDKMTFYVKSGDYLWRIFSFLAFFGVLITISRMLRIRKEI